MTPKRRLKQPSDYPHCTFRPSKDLLERVQKAAGARGVKRSALIIAALEAYLKPR